MKDVKTWMWMWKTQCEKHPEASLVLVHSRRRVLGCEGCENLNVDVKNPNVKKPHMVSALTLNAPARDYLTFFFPDVAPDADG